AGALRGTPGRDGGAGRLEVAFVVNRAWRRGMLGSARLGLGAALRARPEAVLLAPVDHPSVRPRTVTDLARVMLAALAACRTPRIRARFSYALVPRHRRRRGHPVALSPALARAVAADGGAAHLSDAIRRSARLVGYLDVTDAGVVRNRNTPRD
ncbi:MAG TPA: NTP transferase domain-containing protein, partial [Candidatus Eisenbacteria bacterium]